MANQEIVFGLHAVQALLKSSPQRVAQLHLLRGRADQRIQKITKMAEQNQVPVRFASRQSLDDLADGNHQGVVAVCIGDTRVYDEKYLWEMLGALGEAPFLLILDGVTDPHNLGACLRTADAAGVHAVIAPKDNSASLTPVARKVACGAAEVVPYITVTNLARTMQKLQEGGVWITGTAGEAEQDIYQADLAGPMALVMGAEGKGMRRLTREHCDYLVKIPMQGSVSSLNVSVATGVCLFEAQRQRRS